MPKNIRTLGKHEESEFVVAREQGFISSIVQMLEWKKLTAGIRVLSE